MEGATGKESFINMSLPVIIETYYLIHHWYLLCIKDKDVYSSRSTDFEVHRNWLAITNSLPLSQLYYEDTSEWTLDYPPFFAWFEYLLSLIAAVIDPAIVNVNNLSYSAWPCIVFQRLSVIATEGILCLAIIVYCKNHKQQQQQQQQSELAKVTISLQLLCNFGLFIVDHIHFQYNGFLFGILLLSITMIQQGQHIIGAILFAVLLNLKHIFLYIAPVYFVYLLKHYCFGNDKQDNKRVSRPSSLSQLRLSRLVILGGLVIFIFILSFGPFIVMGQLGQVIARLFPFKRGLCHAYWAPNFWALYNTVDKIASITVSRMGLSYLVNGNGTMMSGLVGEMNHQILPNVSPLTTVVMTLVTMALPLFRLWYHPSGCHDFLKCLILCGYSSFLFGWHVHEKAIMMITLPMSFLALSDREMMRVYLVLSFAGHLSLFPLLFTSAETFIKVTAFIAFTVLSHVTIPALHIRETTETENTKRNGILQYMCFPGVTMIDSCLLLSLLLIQIYCIGLHGLNGFMENLPFLPLLLTSVSCAVVVMWSWTLMFYNYIKVNTNKID